MTDLSGKIQTFNRAAVALTGFEKKTAIGSSINHLFEYKVLPGEMDEKSLELLDNGFQQQFVLKKSTGKDTILKSTTTLMRAEDDELQGIIINLVDITQIRKLEEEAERNNRMTAMGEIAMQVVGG